MIQKFQIKDFPEVDSLHDCSTSTIELLGNRLVFCFDKNGLGILSPSGERTYPYSKLKLTYVLIENFYENSEDCSVKQIDERRKLVKRAVKQWSLVEFLDFLNKNQGNLIFFAQYYNQKECLIIAELMKKDSWQMGNWFEIELLVDEIIYEWD